MSWELLVYQFFSMEGPPCYETQVHDCILSDESLQDSNSVLAILRSSLELFKKMNPQIKEIYIRSDNAGMLI